MTEGTVQIPVGRRRIIKRPRLTRVLDDANARLILLIAPAGYGKTTLSRQWLAEGRRKHAWYTATAPSSDVSALALGLARAWLVVDDYHHIGASATAERFFARFACTSGIRLLLTSRSHPAWASARRTTYGEAVVLGTAELALTPTESATVLGVKQDDSLAALLEATQGWPVVTGLAAVTSGSVVPDAPTAEALYDFLAEEVFSSASPDAQTLLCRLAFVSTPTLDVVRRLTDAVRVDQLLDEAERLGLLERDQTELRLHPLLRDFLKARFGEYPVNDREESLAILTQYLQPEHSWDDLFELVKQAPSATRLDALINAALRELVTQGRLGTLVRWCEFAERQRIETPATQLATAEASLLQGKTEAALLLARGAAVGLGDHDPLASRAWIVVGRSAYFLDHYEESLAAFNEAKRIGQTQADLFDTLWNAFHASRMCNEIDADSALFELKPMSGAGIEGAVRLATARAAIAERVGGLEEASEQGLAVLPLLAKVRDPALTTTFLNMLGRLLIGRARYDEAATQFQVGRDVANSLGFRFVLPHVLVGLAYAELGRRRFSLASRLLALARAEAQACGDVHNLAECEMVRIRLLLSLGTPTETLVNSSWPIERPASPSQEGELAALRALAAACTGDLGSCEAFLASAEASPWGTQSVVLCSLARLIAGLVRGGDASQDARLVIETVTSTGWIDPLITACRAKPEIVPLLTSDPSFALTIRTALERSRDHTLIGAVPSVGQSRNPLEGPKLSGREEEVFALLCQGLSNKDIGRALFISGVTVKVHLRHVYRKLGVRTRLEAVARAGGILSDGTD